MESLCVWIFSTSTYFPARHSQDVDRTPAGSSCSRLPPGLPTGARVWHAFSVSRLRYAIFGMLQGRSIPRGCVPFAATTAAAPSTAAGHAGREAAATCPAAASPISRGGAEQSVVAVAEVGLATTPQAYAALKSGHPGNHAALRAFRDCARSDGCGTNTCADKLLRCGHHVTSRAVRLFGFPLCWHRQCMVRTAQARTPSTPLRRLPGNQHKRAHRPGKHVPMR